MGLRFCLYGAKNTENCETFLTFKFRTTVATLFPDQGQIRHGGVYCTMSNFTLIWCISLPKCTEKNWNICQIFTFGTSCSHHLPRLWPNFAWETGPMVYYTMPNFTFDLNRFIQSHKVQLQLGPACPHPTYCFAIMDAANLAQTPITQKPLERIHTNFINWPSMKLLPNVDNILKSINRDAPSSLPFVYILNFVNFFVWGPTPV